MAAISVLMSDPDRPSDGPHQTHEHDSEKSELRARTPRPVDIAAVTNVPEDTRSQTPPRHAIGSPMVIADDAELADDQKDIQPTEKRESVDIDGKDLGEQEEGSDEDGEEDENSRKKRGQRFFCTGYPPCSLSFTRSEHLARHIRKHTGERPFQCHCNRRFSRLDNLRQHAQTVHVNEEIPGDSLAATGTRYQRQIRTDRVRTVPRPRTSTAGSTGAGGPHGNTHARGHSRNLSTSSVGSTSSIYSNAAADMRRRPPPLLMSSDNRPTTPPTYSQFSTHSPGTDNLTTPTSTTFPGTPSSPNFSMIGSPSYTSARLSTENRTPSRRLSVPAGYNPYYPYANPNGPSYGPGPAIASAPTTSSMNSPLSTSYPHSQSSPYSSTEDWRRRTWHSSTLSASGVSYNRPATSGLAYSQTPDTPQPAYGQSDTNTASQAPRLPGIESFDQVQHRPTTPPRSQIGPLINMRQGPPSLLAAAELDRERRLPGHAHHASWDGSRRSLYPEIDDSGRPTTHWGRQTMEHIDQYRDGRPSTSMGPPAQTPYQHQSQHVAQEALQLESASKRVKRSGHHSGFVSAYRTSPDSSSSEGIATPGTSAVEINPTIIGSNGYIEPQLIAGDAQNTRCLVHPTESPGPPSFRPARRPSELDRLDALVAVATSRPLR